MSEAASGEISHIADQTTLQDQLLVSTPYVQAVKDKLDAREIAVEEPFEDSKDLGLTRIHVAKQYAQNPPAEYRNTDGTFNIGLVLEQLRLDFQEENAGWYPTMGKNRALSDNVIGGGSMIYKGVGDPAPISDDEVRLLETRWSGNGTGGRPSEPGSGVRVGIVDTRVLAVAPLAGALHGRYSDMLPLDETAARAGHATFVAGLILSVAPGATIEVRGILNNDGQSDSWEAAKAIVELGNSGVDILNLSFGCVTGDGQPPLALATAIDLVDPGTIVVAAAGNVVRSGKKSAKIDGKEIADISKCASFPAALDNVIAVGSANADAIDDYSPRGAWVDAYANGTDVTSTFLKAGGFDGFAKWTGTSFAAALVSGAIAAETKPGSVTARGAWEKIRNRFAVQSAALGRSGSQIFVAPDQWFG